MTFFESGVEEIFFFFFFFSSRRRHTRSLCDWSSDVCSSDLEADGNDMQNLIGKHRQQSGRPTKQDGEQIESDGCENDMFAQDKAHARLQTAPGIFQGVVFLCRRARNWQYEEAKDKGRDRVDHINTRKIDVRDNEPADGWSNDRSD